MPKINDAFATGFAAAEGGDLPTARNSLATLLDLLPQAPAAFDAAGTPPGDPMRRVPQIQKLQLQAVILSAEGHGDEAIAMAQQAVAAGEGLPYAFGPPSPEKPSYELLGELLLKESRNAPARAAFAGLTRTRSAENRILVGSGARRKRDGRQGSSSRRLIVNFSRSGRMQTPSTWRKRTFNANSLLCRTLQIRAYASFVSPPKRCTEFSLRTGNNRPNQSSTSGYVRVSGLLPENADVAIRPPARPNRVDLRTAAGVKLNHSLEFPQLPDSMPDLFLPKFADNFPLPAHTCSTCDQPGSRFGSAKLRSRRRNSAPILALFGRLP